jgi:signal transduction histidine kinase
LKILGDGRGAVIVEGPPEEVLIPLKIKGDLIGFIDISEKLSEDSYSDEDLSLLTTLAGSLAIAIENASLHEEMLEKERQLFQSDKLASLGTLSAGMAHEIKNPLAILKGMAQSLPENIGDREYLKKISEVVPRQIDRIDNLVEDLIAFSKPKEIEKTAVDVNSIVHDSVKFVNEECKKRGIQLELNLNNRIPMISADRELLTQAFLNLMLNAIQSMQNGGKLSVGTQEAGDRIQIDISDTGHGIDKENISRIFDPFFTTKEKGSGLGLAVTYRIIKEHGGEIEVESEVGVGTKFKVVV